MTSYNIHAPHSHSTYHCFSASFLPPLHFHSQPHTTRIMDDADAQTFLASKNACSMWRGRCMWQMETGTPALRYGQGGRPYNICATLHV